jgi:hypothetical protein
MVKKRSTWWLDGVAVIITVGSGYVGDHYWCDAGVFVNCIYSGCRSRNQIVTVKLAVAIRRVRARTGWGGHGERWRIIWLPEGVALIGRNYGCRAGRWWRRNRWQTGIFNSNADRAGEPTQRASAAFRQSVDNLHHM